MITLEKAAEGKVMIVNVTRRNFLQGALSASAFVLCVGKSPLLARAARTGAPNAVPLTPGSVPSIDATAFHPSIFLGIQPDGTVLIVAHRTEMGNGVRTSLPRIVADELDADWSRVKVIQGDGDERYGSQDTDGSHSVREFFDTARSRSDRTTNVGAPRRNNGASPKHSASPTRFMWFRIKAPAGRSATANWPLRPLNSPCRKKRSSN